MKIKNTLVTVVACMLSVTSANSQVSHSGLVRSTGDIVGFTSAINYGPLDIKNNLNNAGTTYDIDFYIDNNKFVQVLTGGDLNVVQPGNGYMIDGRYIILHKGSTSDLYAGVDAGLAATTGAGNTMIGNEAGRNAAGGNTFIGFQAGGFSGSSGSQYDNVGIGYQALYQNEAYGCVGIGLEAGLENTTGCGLIAIGEEAAKHSGVGNYNIAIGEHALTSEGYFGSNVAIGQFALINLGNLYTPSGTNLHSYNVALGNSSLQRTNHSTDNNGLKNTGIGTLAGESNETGNENTFLGFKADVCPTCTSLVNSTAIGANAIVPDNNQLILGGNSANGDNDVKVGIALSGDNNTTLGYVGPGNQLEINGDPTSFDYTGLGGSGLRFRQLTDANGTTNNTALGVLSVNHFGDVVLVNEAVVGAFNGVSLDAATSQVQLGQDYLTGSGGDLINDREIPMNDNDIYFTEPSVPAGIKNNIGIGIATVPDVRLSVSKTTLPGLTTVKAAQFNSSCGTGNPLDVGWGIQSDAFEFAGTCTELIGGRFTGKGSTKKGTYGVWGQGFRPDAGNVWGGYFQAAAPSPHGGAAFVYGIEGFVQSPVPNTVQYAVYGDLGIPCPQCFLPGGCPACAALATSPNYAGYFNGDVFCSTGFYNVSDANLKENVQDISDPMNIISRLNPKSYTFKQNENRSMQLAAGTHYGLISEEVETLLPQLVKNSVHPPQYDSLGNEIAAQIDFKALNYTELIPFLIAGMKEQQQTIEAMQAQLSNCCGGGNRHSNGGGDEGNNGFIDVELKNAKSIILNQNVPNPFAEQTTITFFITDEVKKAQMFFYDNKGTILKTVDINDKGAGQINVFAADLSSGNYTYTLVANGKVIDSKKMLKTQ